MNDRLKTLVDNVMEKSVVPSFSSIGIRVRSRMFDWPALDSYSLKGRVVVITGATSGIGEAAAHRYAKLGATLVIIARNKAISEGLIAQVRKDTGNNDIHQIIADLGSLQATHQAAEELASRWPVIDVLVHNAGALFNTRKRSDNGTDLSIELMVATPFLLTTLLLDNLKAASDTISAKDRGVQAQAARVISMSSGGMYTQALNVNELQMQDDQYNGAKQYARAKRAQVILNELWAQKFPSEQIVFHALHPGWVNTPGINDALPGFSKVLNPLGLLRTPDEGADTVVWLSADDEANNTNGLFWHDRKPRKIDMSNSTRSADTMEQRKQLWQWCENHTGCSFSS